MPLLFIFLMGILLKIGIVIKVKKTEDEIWYIVFFVVVISFLIIWLYFYDVNMKAEMKWKEDVAFSKGYSKGVDVCRPIRQSLNQTYETLIILNKELNEAKNHTLELRKQTNWLKRELSKKPLFMEIAKDVAKSHNYSDDFNCEDFSRELNEKFRDAGYDSFIEHGYVDCKYFLNCEKYGGYHAWVIVELPIEATTGEVLEPDYYEKVYNP